MMLPFLVPFVFIPLALLFAALAAATVFAILRRAPLLMALFAALAGVGLAIAGLAVRSFVRDSRARKSGRRAGRDAGARSNPEPKRAASVARPEPVGLYADDARRLVDEIKDILKTSPLSPEQKAALLSQVRTVPESTTRALQKIGRLRKIRDMARRMPQSDGVAATLRDIDELEAQLLAELKHMRETLLDISVGLVRVDVARGDRSLDRMVTELSQTNERLSDLAESYGDVRAEQALA